MKTIELINKLLKSLEKNGDIPVTFETYGPTPEYSVEVTHVSSTKESVCLYCGKGLDCNEENIL